MRLLLLSGVLCLVASAAELRGYISDAACGWNNARPGREAKDCAVRCVKAGWDPVFIPDGDTNAYKVSDKSKVMPFVGDHVVINGTLGKDAVRVQSIRRLTK